MINGLEHEISLFKEVKGKMVYIGGISHETALKAVKMNQSGKVQHYYQCQYRIKF